MEMRLIESLLTSAAYDEPTLRVNLLQTHVSYLFITDHYVYKVKKAVDLGFLNFTSLDRRRFYCEEEVRLNRRLSPDMYLGVVEVRETSAGCRIGGDGHVVDYAVKMKRLPEERMLDRLLAGDEVTEADVVRLADVVADFHQKAGRSSEIDRFGRPEVVSRNWEENIVQLLPYAGITYHRDDLRVIREWAAAFLRDRRNLFEERVLEGFVRDCDGDLHAENICLADPIAIFDCIEFAPHFRYSDTAADVAFLLMDFDVHGRPDLSAIFLDHYRQKTGDEGIAALADFYKAYRAVVRGKVESFKLQDRQMGEPEKAVALEKARRYLMLARGYCLRDRLPPSLIITCGLTGSGKSTVARELSLQLGMPVLSSDTVRKKLAGLAPEERDYSAYGAGLYTSSADERTYEELLNRASAILGKGESVIVDATFRRRRDRARFAAEAGRHRAGFFIVHATCSDRLARQRLEARRNAPHEPSDGRWEIYRLQREEFEPVGTDERKHILVDTSRPTHDIIYGILKGMSLL